MINTVLFLMVTPKNNYTCNWTIILFSLLTKFTIWCYYFHFSHKKNFKFKILRDFPKIISSLGFPGSSDSKESVCNAGDPGSIPGLGRCPREGHGNQLQCSCLENPTDRGA